MEEAVDGVSAASSLSLDAANDLLAAFDVADDPDSRAFLADLLASGTAPQDEVDLLCQIEDRAAGRAIAREAENAPSAPISSPSERRRKKRDKNGKSRRTRRRAEKYHKHAHLNIDLDAGVSPFFADDGGVSPAGHGDEEEDGDEEADEPTAEVRPSGAEATIHIRRVTRTVAIYTRRTVLNGIAEPSVPKHDTEESIDTGDAETLTLAAGTSPIAKIKGGILDGRATDIALSGPARNPSHVKSPRMDDAARPAASPARSPSPPRTPACFSSAPSPSKRSTPQPKRKRETTSYFFTPPSRKGGDCDEDGDSSEDDDDGCSSSATTPTKKVRSRRGMVSALPFAPLAAPRFGLVQEQLAGDPFWLLVALVFLVRVAGRVSLPVFWAVKARYPTPRALADADPRDLVAAMRHLGMATVRCAAVQRYARRWLAQPPRAGVCATVKNYPQPPEGLDRGQGQGQGHQTKTEEEEEGEAGAADSQWEIGHLTQGAYAVDSWRIFCRDALLGRSADWKGDGGGAFQPEWMRVLPRDKELRACLRWMWMREGWDWDPRTGERTVLREALRRAVDEGRVGYDAHGQLQIVEEERKED